MKRRIGIIGCGVIGSQLVKSIQSETYRQEFDKKAKLVALCDLDEQKPRRLCKEFSLSVSICGVTEVIRKSDLIIEAASAEIAGEVAERCLKKGKDVLIMSGGGLLGREDILELAEQKKSHLYIPSGALAGFDAAKAAGLGRIFSAVLITRKPPKGLEGAPYVLENKIDLTDIKKERIIFSGNVMEAEKAFPQNINVAAGLSLALDYREITVKIITSPQFKTNSHQLILKGEFGELAIKTDNFPSPDNPKTSYLAVLSAIATLRDILGYVRVGT